MDLPCPEQVKIHSDSPFLNKSVMKTNACLLYTIRLFKPVLMVVVKRGGTKLSSHLYIDEKEKNK
jgi:hypothetical protein